MRSRSSVMLALMAVVMNLAPSAASAVAPIQPGSRISIEGVPSCTLGFIFDGKGRMSGKVFGTTAAHCAPRPGLKVSLLESQEVFGKIAVTGGFDWALVEVFPAYYERVSASVKGYPRFPSGYTRPWKTRYGDAIQQTDWPYGGIPRQARMLKDAAREYSAEGPVISTDSGGPVVHVESGAALGLVSWQAECHLPSTGCSTFGGPSVQGILSMAADEGFPIALRTI